MKPMVLQAEVADALGSDPGSVTRTIHKDDFQQEVIRAALSPEADPEANWRDDLLDQARVLLDTEEIREALLRIGQLELEVAMSDVRIFAQMILWGMSSEDEDIRSRLRDLYDYYDRAHENLVTDYLARVEDKLDRRVRRTGMTPREFMTIATALIEGLALRRHVDPAAVPDDLIGRALVALAASAWDGPGDGEALGESLAGLQTPP
ncbi:MAG: hypothetical protein GY701_20990 [Sulfitobacter sp.]|nr:hypothetical protein [Sulfitobacter sp.]